MDHFSLDLESETKNALLRRIGEVPEAPDVTIRLVPNRVAQEDEPDVETLAVVKAHSKVLSTYSRYFSTCLSETWKGGEPSAGEFEQSLEVQADEESYFDCFSRMYSLFLGSFEFGLKDFPDVESSLELLKVASQIQFEKLVGSVLLYLSSTFWDEGDEMRVREYSSSPDFPRSQAEDLVARLGLNESEEEHHKRLYDMLQRLISTALDTDTDPPLPLSRYQNFITELLQRSAKPSATRSNFDRTVVVMLTGEARRMLVGLNEDCVNVKEFKLSSLKTRVEVMCFLLKALLAVKLADEVVQYFVHLDAIPNSYKDRATSSFPEELAELVLLICQEVVAGHIPLRIQGRIALLTNWHPLLKRKFHGGKLKKVTRRLFSTLPVKDRMEFIKACRWTGPRDFNDFITNESLILLLSKSSSWPAVWIPSADDTTTSSESSCKEGSELPIGVVTASQEAGTSRAKLDVAFFSWVWLIVESGNILRVRQLLLAQSSAPEVKNERVEAFAREFILAFCPFAPTFPVLCQLGSSICATFFTDSLSMQKSPKWVSHHLHTPSSLIGSLFCLHCSNFS